MPIIEGSVSRGQAIERPGQEFYVDPTNGVSTAGGSLGSPVATIAQALALCVSGRGDTIYLLPGTYAETVTIAKDYIALIGQVGGYGRPDVVPAAGLALSVTTGQGFYCKGVRFASDGQDSDVARIQGNGFHLEDCVFDGESGMGATKALLRLWCHASDDSYTASEGVIKHCLFRGSPGYGLVADVQNAAVGVGPTHMVVEHCRFISNTAEDLIALETAVGTYSMQDWLIHECFFGMGTGKNKATHIDISTNNGATNTGNAFTKCFINDDTVDTTAIKAAGTTSSFIGCYNLDGVINGDALD